MTFYHGTNMVIGKIDLSRSRNRVDFGKGFYLTDKFGTARDWSIRKVELEGEGMPTVLSYEVNSDIYKLYGNKFFSKPDFEWLDFICSNRSFSQPNAINEEPRHDFNWVSGPIADDKVVDVVAEYMREEIDAKEAIRRLRALPQTYQLSLHTPASLGFVNDENVLFRQFVNGRWSQNWVRRK